MVGLVIMAVLLGGLLETASGVRDEREVVKAALEESLLKMLGLSKRPEPSSSIPREYGTRRPIVPPEMLALYHQQAQLETAALPLPGRMANTANTARSFIHSGLKRRPKRNDRFRLHFNTSDIPKEEKVTGAELKVWLGPGAYRVSVHDIIRPGIKGKSKPFLRLLDTKRVSQQEETVSLDVMPAAERWTTQNGLNHGLLVQISKRTKSEDENDLVETNNRSKRSTYPTLDQHTLLLYLDDGRNKHRGLEDMISRQKRASQGKKHRRKDGKETCRRHNLKVDFKDVGWDDWIVAPPGYDAFYCHGDCPFPLADHLNSTNHAVVQTLVNSVNPSAVPKACCVPTQLSSISMLYLDDNKVVLKNYQDMAVVGCGCR